MFLFSLPICSSFIYKYYLSMFYPLSYRVCQNTIVELGSTNLNTTGILLQPTFSCLKRVFIYYIYVATTDNSVQPTTRESRYVCFPVPWDAGWSLFYYMYICKNMVFHNCVCIKCSMQSKVYAINPLHYCIQNFY